MSLARVQIFSISLDGFGTGDGPEPARHRSATPATGCTSGCSPPGGGPRDGRRAWGHRRRRRHLPAPARSRGRRRDHGRRASSARPAGTRTRSGRAGGVRTRRSTRRPSSSPITRARRSRWRAARRSTSSTPSPAEALATAREAAGGQDVRLGGGPTLIREFAAAGLVDHMHLVVVPILLGRANASGTGWRVSRRTTRSRPLPRPAESRT